MAKGLFLGLLALALLAGSVWSYPKILFLGDSLTEGLGVEKEQSYVAIASDWLKTHGYPGTQGLNGGISGSTSASGPSRMKWFAKGQFDYVFLALGANDGLRGLDVKAMEANLATTITLAQKSGIKVWLAGMKMPDNYGKAYQKSFGAVFPYVAKKYHLPFYPFLLDGVAMDKNLNQADGIHPNVAGHKVIAAKLEIWLKKQLDKQKKP